MAKFEMDWEVSKTYPVKTVGQLRRLFYRNHVYREPHKPRIGFNPLAFKLNPPQFVNEHDITAVDTWVAVYGQLRINKTNRYFVTIEHHPKSMFGPHVARLNILIYPGKEAGWDAKSAWLGTAQFEGNFFDEKRMRINLKRAIRLKEYYASLQTETKVVTFDEPRPVSTLIL